MDRILRLLRLAGHFANEKSSCSKVKVGSLLIDQHGRVTYGANRVIPNTCDTEKESWADKDCNKNGHCVSTIHSEIDAIIKAKTDLIRGTIFVTRYPCEACARAIVVAGIKKVYYGRERAISDETKSIFDAYNVEVHHITEYKEDDVM
jgi:dCMP deaminase